MIIIAIDGPAAAGKGTLCKLIAKHYNLDHLDTGSLYRATALKLIKKGDDPENTIIASKAAKDIRKSDLTSQDLRSEEVARIASLISEKIEVRIALLEYQRSFAKSPPNGLGAVIEGRDIGTVVCPKANIKLFVNAKLEVRARRRYEELINNGNNALYEKILSQMSIRDQRDQNRLESPLFPAADAHLIDTTELDIEGAFLFACKLIERLIIPN